MSRKDAIHDYVVNALINAGWTITKDPLHIEVGKEKKYKVDIGAEKWIVAKKQNQKIGVEIKSFYSHSIMHEFHEALGQYLIYRDVIEMNEMEHQLFLAVSDEAYIKITELEFFRKTLEKYEVKVIVVNLEEQKIMQWIN